MTEGNQKKARPISLKSLARFERYLTKVDDFPLEPIHPESLIDAVTEKLTEFEIILSHNTPTLIMEMCKTFNYAITQNKMQAPTQKLVMSPQTGSAKSVCAQVYISLLTKESSLMVVSRVDVAIAYCEHINAWSGNPNYARCIYQISSTNANHPLRVDKEALKEHRCIIMTHNMFIRVNKSNEVNRYKNIDRKARDLVIIDERLKLYDKYTVHKNQVEALADMNQVIAIDAYTHNQIGEKLADILALMGFLKEAFEKLHALSLKSNFNIIYSTDSDECSLIQLELQSEWERMLQENFIQYLKENHIRFVNFPLLPKESNAFNKHAKATLLFFLSCIEKLAQHPFFYYKDGNDESITAIVSIHNHFGTHVMLDATANINAYYEYELVNEKLKANLELDCTTKLIQTTQTKRYENVTIHIAKGFFQGKKAIFEKGYGTKEAKLYLGLIHHILEGNSDKLLIITTKAFRKALQLLTTNKRIRITHWGDHIGKNEWNDCVRVMVIGWYFFKNIEYYTSFVGANATVKNATLMHGFLPKVRYRFKVTQLVDDLVQAVNRSAIRNVIDEEGNCPKSHIYMFYASTDEYRDVMRLFLEQFRGAKVERWFPRLQMHSIQPKSKPEKKVDTIVAYILTALAHNAEVLLTDVIEGVGMPKATISRLMALDIFKEALLQENLSQKKVDKKSIVFYRT